MLQQIYQYYLIEIRIWNFNSIYLRDYFFNNLFQMKTTLNYIIISSFSLLSLNSQSILGLGAGPNILN